MPLHPRPSFPQPWGLFSPPGRGGARSLQRHGLVCVEEVPRGPRPLEEEIRRGVLQEDSVSVKSVRVWVALGLGLDGKEFEWESRGDCSRVQRSMLDKECMCVSDLVDTKSLWALASLRSPGRYWWAKNKQRPTTGPRLDLTKNVLGNLTKNVTRNLTGGLVLTGIFDWELWF